MRYTPENLNQVERGEIFVFGSNESGFHGAGAARFAVDKLGARMGQGFGLMGRSFGLPTKDWNIKTLDLESIKFYVGRFIEFAKLHPHLTFLVTKIGCGLASLKIEDIAPMFKNAKTEPNIILPKEFWDTKFIANGPIPPYVKNHLIQEPN